MQDAPFVPIPEAEMGEKMKKHRVMDRSTVARHCQPEKSRGKGHLLNHAGARARVWSTLFNGESKRTAILVQRRENPIDAPEAMTSSLGNLVSRDFSSRHRAHVDAFVAEVPEHFDQGVREGVEVDVEFAV